MVVRDDGRGWARARTGNLGGVGSNPLLCEPELIGGSIGLSRLDHLTGRDAVCLAENADIVCREEPRT